MSNTFSIIMPAYNVEKYISDSINSVLNQTYPYFELIIIDDGSTDNTFGIIERFTDTRIRVIRQSNKGLGATRNVGIGLAKNDLIAFLDSDDIWHREKLANIISNVGDENVGIYHSNVMEFKQDISDAIPNRYTEPIKLKNTRDIILVYDFVIVSSAVVPKHIMLEMGGFAEDLYGTEDWDLWIRIGQKYSFKKILAFDCYYRMNENGLSKKRDEFLKKEFKVIERHVLSNQSIPKSIKKLSLWVWYKKNFYYNLSNFKIGHSTKYFLKMLKSNPLEPANFDFFTRAFKKVLNKGFNYAK